MSSFQGCPYNRGVPLYYIIECPCHPYFNIDDTDSIIYDYEVTLHNTTFECRNCKLNKRILYCRGCFTKDESIAV